MGDKTKGEKGNKPCIELRKYQVVLFLRPKGNVGNKLDSENDDEQATEENCSQNQVDFVPCHWLRVDEEERVFTRYPPPPYTKTTINEFRKLVRNASPPFGIWPEYLIELRGHARTYQHALKRVMQLANTKEYVYTTADDEKTPQEKSKAVKRTIRYSNLTTNFDKQDKLMSSALSVFQPSTSPTMDSQQLPIASPPSISDDEPEVLNDGENDLKSASAPSPIEIPRENSVTKPPKRKATSESEDAGTLKKRRILTTDDEESDVVKNDSMSASAPNPVEISRENSVTKTPKRKATSEAEDAGSLKNQSNNCSIFTTADGRRILEKDVFSLIVTAKEKENIGLLLERMLMGQYLLNVQQKNIINKLNHIGGHLQSLEENFGNEANVVKLVQDFAEEFDLNLPFAQLQEFQTFDDQLETDRTFRKRFKSTLSDLFTTDISVTLAQKNMIQKYISRSVVLQYTAQKKTEKKSLVFKNTRFYRAMLDVMSSKYKAQKLTLTEKDFLRDLGLTISNAKDWEGYRLLRSRKSVIE